MAGAVPSGRLGGSVLDVQLLGPVAARSTTGPPARPPGAKLRALLAALALAPGEPVLVEELIDELGLADSCRNATNTLQAHVRRLRGWLERELDVRGAVVTTSAGYLLAVASDQVDAGRFGAALERAGRAADPQRRIRALGTALSCWHGAALADAGDGPICRRHRAALRELRATAREELVTAQIATGRERAAIPELERLVVEYPLREQLWEQLMLALYRSGRHAEAIGQYHRLRRLLDEELGLQPGPALRRCLSWMLNHEPDRHAADQRSAVP